MSSTNPTTPHPATRRPPETFRSTGLDNISGRTTRRVLARLKRDGLLRTLERRVGGVRSGSASAVWHLAPAGIRIVFGDKKRRRSAPPSQRFLAHCLAVADVHVVLRQHEQIETIEHVVVEVEPKAWRRYIGPAGEPRWLQPDLYAEISTADFTDLFFIEVDLGTESLPTLLGKCEQYEAYRRSGVEQDRHGNFPLVLWLFLDRTRRDKLAAAVRRGNQLTEPMYRFTTPETLTQVLAGGTA
ncbi:replication-relaxation family protein [Gordonia iterans]